MADTKGKDERPNYYAILPANVRYSEELTHLEKILYAEITALSNKEGHCFATNAYFAKHYKNSIRTISRSVSNLEEKGFIYSLYESVGGVTNRKIYIRKEGEELPFPINIQVLDRQKRLGGIDKNVSHNSINSNSINNTNTVNTPPAEQDEKIILPSWLGKNSHARLGRLYELLWERNMHMPHKLHLTGVTGATFKKLLAEYSEVMVGLMLVLHFEWKGMSGSDTSVARRLRDNGYPIGWLPQSAAVYQAFITQHMKADTDQKCAGFITLALEELSKPA